jgi:hypothetical protein
VNYSVFPIQTTKIRILRDKKALFLFIYFNIIIIITRQNKTEKEKKKTHISKL